MASGFGRLAGKMFRNPGFYFHTQSTDIST